MTKKKRWSPLIRRATKHRYGIYRFKMSAKQLIALGEFAKHPTSVVAVTIEDPDGYIFSIEFEIS